MPPISPRWDTLSCDASASNRLAAALDVPPVVARLLCLRGLDDPETALRFLNPVLDHLHDPLLLADMRIAVDRIMAAIASAVCDVVAADAADTVICWMNLIPRIFFITVV